MYLCVSMQAKMKISQEFFFMIEKHAIALLLSLKAYMAQPLVVPF